MNVTSDDLVLYLAVALAISEALAQIPAIRANSIHQLIWNVLKALAPKRPA
jgi:hypothetical protein